MKLEIKKERDTPLLSRKRVTLVGEYERSTPSRIDIRKEVAKKVNAKENLVVIKHIYTKYGSHKAKIIAHVYSNEDEMKKIEEEVLLKKQVPKGEGGQKEKPKEDKPKEEKKEEKKEKKEEKKP